MDQTIERLFMHAQEAIKDDKIDVIKNGLHPHFVVNCKHTTAYSRQGMYPHTFYDVFNEQYCTTLLQTAVFYAKPEITRFILSLGAKADAASLHIAAVGGNVEIFELLLGVGKGDASARDRDGFTACHYAAMYGRLDIVKILLHHGVQIDVQTDCLETPLLVAAKHERLDVVNFLLEKGAKVDTADASGYTALCRSIEVNNYQIVKRLIQDKANVNVLTEEDSTPLLLVTNQKIASIDIFNLLMESGADATFCSENGDTPLQCACVSKEGIHMVKSLLAGRADVNQDDGYGESPLHTACSVKDNYDVALTLIDAGADVNMLSCSDKSALDHAVHAGDASMVRLLIERGACPDDVLETVLHEAVRTKCVDILQQILAFVQDKNVIDNNGFTALMLATQQQWAQGVSMMCEGGARVDIQNEAGMTVLHVAVSAGANTAIVKCLLKRQPDLNSICTHRTALEAALHADNTECFKEILASATNGAVPVDHSSGQVVALLLIVPLMQMQDPAPDLSSLNQFVQLHALTMAHEPQRLTLMHYALILKKTAVSEHLIKSGIRLNISDRSGRSLLFYAVYSRENSILDLMLRAGVPITHTRDGLVTLITACKIGNLEASDMLLRYYSGDDALVMAIHRDEVDAVDVLLKRQYTLPADLREQVHNSPRTKKLLRRACIHFVATNPSDNPGRVGQNNVFSDENLSTSIVCASTGWSLQNVELLRKNYRTQ